MDSIKGSTQVNLTVLNEDRDFSMDSTKDSTQVNVTVLNEDRKVYLSATQTEHAVDVEVNEIFGTGVLSVTQTKLSHENGGENEFAVVLTNGNTSKFKYYNGEKGGKGDKGDKGGRGYGIKSIEFKDDSTMHITVEDGSTYDSMPLRGQQGLKGDKGDKGDQGIQGVKGDKGETGGVIIPTFIVDKDGNLIMYYDDQTK